MKNLLFLILFFGLINNTISQDKSFKKLVSVGISQPILNNGTGFHIGFNPSFELTNTFSFEGQLSYIYNNIDSFFLTGDYGSSNDINLLCGGRFYMNSAENKNRFFIKNPPEFLINFSTFFYKYNTIIAYFVHKINPYVHLQCT